ncbi:hypothetical protein AX15_000837 [Amanita polypyramis BW_CC]|nr:hypothetical protein AX15_000837 [Amanita polypyramis BW_CC]
MLPSHLQSQLRRRTSPISQSQEQSQPRLQSQPQPVYTQSSISTSAMPSEQSVPLSINPGFPEASPFLPYHAAQRIIKRYPESTSPSVSTDVADVARATLLQMSEMSRRADNIGFTYDETEGGSGGVPDDPKAASASAPAAGPISDNTEIALSELRTPDVTSASGGRMNGSGPAKGKAKARSSSRIWQAAANAGLLSDLGLGDAFMGTNVIGNNVGAGPSTSKAMSSQEMTTTNMEEMQRNATRSESGDAWMAAQGLNSLASGGVGASTFERNGTTRNTASGAVSGPSANDEDSHSIMTHEGLQIYTVGHLLPRETIMKNGRWGTDDTNGPSVFFGMEQFEDQPQILRQLRRQQQPDFNSPYNACNRDRVTSVGEGAAGTGEDEVVRPSPNQGAPMSEPTTASPAFAQLGTARKLRVRRSTFVPGWAVPPRVLLVDDDAVTRKLSSRFLQVFGCTIDVAVDGVGAVNKMNLEKYDLVLMDIVMPKLDGVSATSLIRKFDCMTPIISMTSNSKPNEILKYFSSGTYTSTLHYIYFIRLLWDGRYERYPPQAFHEAGSTRHVGETPNTPSSHPRNVSHLASSGNHQ